MIKINSFIIIQLTKPVVNGLLEDGSIFYTDPLIAIFGNYLVTERKIYLLGEPDSIWLSTTSGKETYKQHYNEPIC